MLQIDDKRKPTLCNLSENVLSQFAYDQLDCGRYSDVKSGQRATPADSKDESEGLNYEEFSNRRFSAPVNADKIKIEFETKKDQMIFHRKFQLMERQMKSDKFPFKLLRKAFAKEIREYYDGQLS